VEEPLADRQRTLPRYTCKATRCNPRITSIRQHFLSIACRAAKTRAMHTKVARVEQAFSRTDAVVHGMSLVTCLCCSKTPCATQSLAGYEIVKKSCQSRTWSAFVPEDALTCAKHVAGTLSVMLIARTRIHAQRLGGELQKLCVVMSLSMFH
jgi:hypothetical protein